MVPLHVELRKTKGGGGGHYHAVLSFFLFYSRFYLITTYIIVVMFSPCKHVYISKHVYIIITKKVLIKLTILD